MGEKRRNICFNIEKPMEKRLYELSRQINLSGFVKRCLADELKRREEPPEAVFTVRLGDVT